MKATESLKRPGAQPRGVHLSMHALYDPPLDRWINRFLDQWLATDKRVPVIDSEPLSHPVIATGGVSSGALLPAE
jgi:hypothetical protein